MAQNRAPTPCGLANDLAGSPFEKVGVAGANAKEDDMKLSVSFQFAPSEKMPVGTLFEFGRDIGFNPSTGEVCPEDVVLPQGFEHCTKAFGDSQLACTNFRKTFALING